MYGERYYLYTLKVAYKIAESNMKSRWRKKNAKLDFLWHDDRCSSTLPQLILRCWWTCWILWFRSRIRQNVRCELSNQSVCSRYLPSAIFHMIRQCCSILWSHIANVIGISHTNTNTHIVTCTHSDLVCIWLIFAPTSQYVDACIIYSSIYVILSMCRSALCGGRHITTTTTTTVDTQTAHRW